MDIEKITRQRYDTHGLIERLKEERKRGLLIVGGVAAGVLLISIVIMSSGWDEEEQAELRARVEKSAEQMSGVSRTAEQPPRGEETAADTEGDANTAESAADEPAAEEREPPAARERAPARKPSQSWSRTKATLQTNLGRTSSLLIDGKSVAKGPQQVQLAPGKHQLKLQIAGTLFALTMDVAAGEVFELRMDSKKKKPQLRKVR